MTSPRPERVAVLLMAYGGPNSLEDIPAYLSDVRHGRPYSPEFLAELTERYRQIGGRSPILELTQAQAAGIARALNDGSEAGRVYQVFVGMRHWHPYIREVIPDIVASNPDRLVGVVMAPHYSRMSVGAYLERLQEALAEHHVTVPVTTVTSWKDEPAFIAALTERVREALTRFPADIRDQVTLLLTAHSLPERILQWGDPYPEELLTTARLLAANFPSHPWRFAFQSQGASEEPWLGPAVEDVVAELASQGVRDILVAPIGFLCDHVEILYDIDIELQQVAAELGVHLERIVSLNDHPLLCQAVANVVRAALAGEATANGAPAAPSSAAPSTTPAP